MKVFFHLTWMRLSEQPAKLLYLAVTLAAGVLTWMVLSAFASPRLLSGAGDVIKASLHIGNARVKYGSFPVRYIPRIQQMPGVDSLVWFEIVGFNCTEATRNSVTVSAYGGDVDDQLRRSGANETDLAVWHTIENGVLVRAGLANRCGFIPGNTISPVMSSGREIPLHVVGILPGQGGGIADEVVYAHYDYINRFLSESKQNQVISATVRVRDPGMLDQIAVMIEREFQSSDPPLETRVFTETSILGRFGQVQALLLMIMGAMALCVFLVFCAVLVHLTAQRRASMAVLQTMGFTGRIQFFALLLEITGVVVVGAACGIAAGYGALALLTPWASDTLLSPDLRPVDGAILVLLPALLLLLTAALFWPAVQIAKLRPLDYLRL